MSQHRMTKQAASASPAAIVNTRRKADFGVLGGGIGNTIGSGAWVATIAGGYSNDIGTNSDYSAIGGGQDSVIANNAQYATISGGRAAWAGHFGQWAYASGRFTSAGDAQSGLYVLKGVGTTGVCRWVTTVRTTEVRWLAGRSRVEFFNLETSVLTYPETERRWTVRTPKLEIRNPMQFHNPKSKRSTMHSRPASISRNSVPPIPSPCRPRCRHGSIACTDREPGRQKHE